MAVLHDQEQLLFRAYGMADKERQIPMRTDSIFRMFSMTKPVTAVVTMQLLEDGLLELSDPVSWYIPSFREKWWMRTANSSRRTGRFASRIC